MSNIEKQILYFGYNRLSSFNEYENSIIREMNQLKNIIETGNSPFKKVLKSYVRNCYRIITCQFITIISNLHSNKWLKEFIKKRHKYINSEI